METEHTELLVLGSGPAGYYCALEAARAGFRTALAEKAELGGTGFRWGCLPVKMGLDALRRGRPTLPRQRDLHPDRHRRLPAESRHLFLDGPDLERLREQR